MGSWQLVETQVSFGAVSTFYEDNDVTYTFNSDGTLEIISTIAEFESQITTYEITEDCFFEDCPPDLSFLVTDIITIGDYRNLLLQIDEEILKFGTNDIGDGTDFIFERQ
ncbi:hypothetical protein [uncultured Winogradskyella sp.]|uniref:hypothetical protein n=1 Tax=uncultured Winogradskyella sp. TaxID=395353 RepID=UPI00262132BA|nr:hypothetical protein [uncultured Winogradskyella sp.]